jgi:tetratricopeptide (TPR) repeat protein
MEQKIQSLKKIFLEAVEHYNKRDLKAAEVVCYKILSIDQNNFDSISLLSNIFAINNDYIKAKEFLLRGLELQPSNKTILNNLGTASKELGELNEAIKFYQKVLKIDSNHTNANYNLALIFYKSKNLTEAKKYLEKTVKIQPNYALAHFNLGNLQKEFKELKQAELSYLKAIELKPSFANAHNNLGLIFSEMGNAEEAICSYNRAIEINPKHAGAYNNLGRIYTETGEFEKAVDAHILAIKLEPENLMHSFYLCELKKSFLDLDLKNKIEKILNNKPHPLNLVFGNFLLSRYGRDEKNYEKEVDHLKNAHKYYFNVKKEKFDLGIKYCFEDVLQISNFAELQSEKEIINHKVKPIFIIGVPRSGSTLVEKVIGSGKKNISMGEEISVLENFINNKILEEKSLNLGSAKIFREELINAYKQKGLIQEKNNLTFTDKSLNNFFYLNLINKVFPEAKVINCDRKVISSIMSIFQNNLTELAWAHNLENIFKYFDNYFQIINKFKKKNPNLLYNLDFEKFTGNPEIESKKLMAFCDLPWDQKCLEFYKRKDIFSKTTSRQQIRQPIYKNTVDRYLPYKFFLDEYGKKYSWYN